MKLLVESILALIAAGAVLLIVAAVLLVKFCGIKEDKRG